MKGHTLQYGISFTPSLGKGLIHVFAKEEDCLF